MPIYEYRCKKCAQRFELMRRLDDRDKPATCTECGSKRTERSAVTAFAFLGGASPDAGLGEGEPEDFDDDGHGHGHDHGMGMPGMGMPGMGMPGMGMPGMGMDDDFDF